MRPVREPFDVVVATNSGYPLDLNLYQTVKGMSAAAQIVKEGGSILVASECSDGIPSHGHYRELLHSRSSPAELLVMVKEPGFRVPDGWEVQLQAEIQLKAEEIDPIRRMVANVYNHPEAAKLLAATLHIEFSVIFEDAANGLHLRARPDLIANGSARGVTLVEFKTTRQTEPRRFIYDVLNYGYHRQFAWYREALEQFGYTVIDNVIITTDKSPARQCRVYRLSDESLQMGHRENLETRADLARRLAEDDWLDSLDTAICPIDLEEKLYALPETQT